MKIKHCQISTTAGPISYFLVRSSRRKTIAIQISQDIEVRVFAPRFVSEKEIVDFIHQKAFWITEKVCDFEKRFSKKKKSYFDGDEFLFLGTKHRLHYCMSSGKRIKIDFSPDGWKVHVPKIMSQKDICSNIKESLARWYQKEAKEILASRIFRLARQMKVSPSKVAVRTQKKIWGSCHYYKKGINLNWKIIMAPFEVIDYIIVHELVHLEVPNHSRKFWNKVKNILPSYKQYEKWLYDHSGLMALS